MNCYRGNGSSKSPFEDVSLVEERPDEGAPIERGGSREARGDLVGDEPQTEEVVHASRRKG